MTKIYEIIRAAIEDSGKSHYRICKDADIEESVLSRFMAGKRGLSVESMEKIANSIGYSLTLRRNNKAR